MKQYYEWILFKCIKVIYLHSTWLWLINWISIGQFLCPLPSERIPQKVFLDLLQLSSRWRLVCSLQWRAAAVGTVRRGYKEAPGMCLQLFVYHEDQWKHFTGRSQSLTGSIQWRACPQVSSSRCAAANFGPCRTALVIP